jgi:hypothetical protein
MGKVTISVLAFVCASVLFAQDHGDDSPQPSWESALSAKTWTWRELLSPEQRSEESDRPERGGANNRSPSGVQNQESTSTGRPASRSRLDEAEINFRLREQERKNSLLGFRNSNWKKAEKDLEVSDELYARDVKRGGGTSAAKARMDAAEINFARIEKERRESAFGFRSRAWEKAREELSVASELWQKEVGQKPSTNDIPRPKNPWTGR